MKIFLLRWGFGLAAILDGLVITFTFGFFSPKLQLITARNLALARMHLKIAQLK